MSITDELREYALGWDERNRVRRDLTAIADRIDAEHEAALLNVHIDLMDASGWVRLPKDADGEYIHIGDRMEWVRYKDDEPTVVRTVSGIGNGVFFAWSDEQGRYAQYEAHAYRHYHAPTVEDVLREMLDAWGELPSNATNEAIVAEYAKRLTLAEGED